MLPSTSASPSDTRPRAREKKRRSVRRLTGPGWSHLEKRSRSKPRHWRNVLPEPTVAAGRGRSARSVNVPHRAAPILRRSDKRSDEPHASLAAQSPTTSPSTPRIRHSTTSTTCGDQTDPQRALRPETKQFQEETEPGQPDPNPKAVSLSRKPASPPRPTAS